jgi:hypothetical protein
MHCPYCEKRVAKLYRGLGGYFCRATLRRKIGAEVGICSSIEKPKGMHRREGSGHRAIPRRFTLRSIAKPISLSRREGVRPRTFDRARERIYAAEEIVEAHCDLLLARLKRSPR